MGVRFDAGTTNENVAASDGSEVIILVTCASHSLLIPITAPFTEGRLLEFRVRMCLTTDDATTHRHEAAQRITKLSTDGQATPKRSLLWKGSVEELLGFHAKDIPTDEGWWLARIHPEDLFDVVNSLSRILAPAPKKPYAAEARIWAHDYRFKHANGEFLLISERSIVDRDESGNVLSMTSSIFDSEKRRIERKAHREFLDSRNQFALIANNTPSGIWMMDNAGMTTYMNHAAESITGFRFEEIAGWTFHAAVHSCRPDGSPYPVTECPIFRHQQSETQATNESEVFVHKNGSFYDIVYSVSPIGDYASGGAVIEFRDVTAQKKLERERLAAIVQNEQQSVLIKASEDHKANMSSFVSFVCHELRNPLQGISSATEFLSETLEKLDTLTKNINSDSSIVNGKSNGPTNGVTDTYSRAASKAGDESTIDTVRGLVTYAQELVSNIAVCASHQALITNNVLDLSRLDAGKVEPSYDVVDLRALSKEAVGMMVSRARVKSINLRLKNDDAPPLYLKADSTLMSQILLNLIGNAVKFTPENGNIVVDISSDLPGEDGRIVFHGSVTDDGVGMTEAEQQRLFKRFSQANKRVAQTYKGSGLGLSISKEIVKVLGGDMAVKSTAGVGSTFSFTTIHDYPTESELDSFLKSGDGVIAVSTDLEKFELLNSESKAPIPKFKKICVAEDNP
jgi:PAS domain S-box-containing protein